MVWVSCVGVAVKQVQGQGQNFLKCKVNCTKREKLFLFEESSCK